ncbi:MAG: hypothetical protein JXM69_18055 [Anaerolineae bacterium]|nr:hypothetical protein [Anaerolineae bacterium]
MGIIHLAPTGRSPGAVTAPLAHLEHVFAEQQDNGQRLEKSVLPRRLGYPVEAIVLFVSDPMRRAYKGHAAYETIYNKYGSREAIHVYPKERHSVNDIVADFVEKALRDAHKTTLYVRQVNVNDFNDCFRVIAETVLALGRPDDLGKTLWANLTGGTNILNAALLEVTFLSGLISNLYYIFTDGDDRKYLQPVTTDYRRFVDNHWRDVPLVKTNFDERYRHLLFFLAAEDKWWETAQLFYALQSQFPEAFQLMQLELFQKQWLRKMGRDLDWELAENNQETGRVRLTEAGYQTIGRLEGNLFQTLVQRGDAPLIDIQALRDKLDTDKIDL